MGISINLGYSAKATMLGGFCHCAVREDAGHGQNVSFVGGLSKRVLPILPRAHSILSLVDYSHGVDMGWSSY